MTWSVHPEPSDETERRVLLDALDQALTKEQDGARAYATPWWRSGFEDLGVGEPGGLGETPAVPQGRAARPEAASSVAPVWH